MQNLRDTTIFEPFFTTKSAGQGSGLGLATTYAIIQRNGGRIEVADSKGAGAVFRITLPAAPAGARKVDRGGARAGKRAAQRISGK